uniref:Uncharacterized protein n=1 Tax=Arundo donax TaxID=35708 RepID=A0A0A9DBH3_ARUDO
MGVPAAAPTPRASSFAAAPLFLHRRVGCPLLPARPPAPPAGGSGGMAQELQPVKPCSRYILVCNQVRR